MSEQSGSATTQELVLATPTGRATDAFDSVLPSATQASPACHMETPLPPAAKASRTAVVPRFLIAVVAAVIVAAAVAAAVAAIVIATNDTDDVTIGAGQVGVVGLVPGAAEVTYSD